MLHIILLILKIIGIVILALLGILLGVLLLVLFVPIRYVIEGEKKAELTLHGRVSWLLRILCVKFQYIGNEFQYKVKVFGITIIDSLKPRVKKIKQKKKRKVKKKKVTRKGIRTKSKEKRSLDTEEKQLKVEKLKEKELNNKELKEKELNNEKLNDKELKDKELKDKELKEKELNNEKLNDKELNDEKLQEEELREKKLIKKERIETDVSSGELQTNKAKTNRQIADTPELLENEEITIKEERTSETKSCDKGTSEIRINEETIIRQTEEKKETEVDQTESKKETEANQTEPQETLEDEDQENENPKGIWNKIKGFFKKIKAGVQKLKDIYLKIKNGLVNWKEKINNIGKIKDNILDFIRDVENKAGFSSLFLSFGKVLKHIKPRVFKFYIEFGTGDPCTTGQALGVLGILYSYYGEYVQIVPNFTEAKYEGVLYARGRIRLFTLLIICIKLIRDKKFKYLVERMKKIKEEL